MRDNMKPQKPSSAASPWRGKSYGGYFGNLCFALLLRIGMYPAYGLLFFVSLYFMVFRRESTRWGAVWLSRVLGKNVGTLSLSNWRLLRSFGTVLLDKVSFLSGAGKIICSDSECQESIKTLISGGRGLLVVTAHVGGWEMASSLLKNYGREVGMLGAAGESAEIENLVRRETGTSGLNIIGDSSDALSMLPAYAALKRGAIIALHADRYAGGRFARVRFFGKTVKVPLSAYILAAKAHVPVLQIACFREKRFVYKVKTFKPMFPTDARGAELDMEAEKYARQFMSNLESALSVRPFQWFNFYDFWGGKEKILASAKDEFSNP